MITKNNYKKNNKISKTILLIIVIYCLMLHHISDFFKKDITKIIYKEITNNNIKMIKNAFFAKRKMQINYDELFKITKNKNNEIIDIVFDVENCEKIVEIVMNDINNEIKKETIKGFLLEVPIGYMSNTPLFMNNGPKVPVVIKYYNIATSNIKTNIKDYGINNSLIELYVEVVFDYSMIIPINNKTKQTKYNILISSIIINGKVPNFYGGSFGKEL